MSKSKKVTVTLNLDEAVVKKIEKLTGEDIVTLFEREMSKQNCDAFIEALGYDDF